jgi:F0F1-type ATP synthase delta subunit
MPKIRDTFKKPVERRSETVHIITAVPCTESQKDKLEAKFGHSKDGVEIDYTFLYEVDPSILAGVVIKTENNMFDASYKNKLSILKKEVSDQIELDRESGVEGHGY